MKKALSILIIAIMAFGAGCTNQTVENQPEVGDYLNTESEFPIVNEKINLKAVGVRASTHGNWNELMVFKKAEELTNIHIDFECYSNDIWSQKKNLLLASSDLPDIFYAIGSNAADEIRYGKSGNGAFVPLQDYIENHAPRLHSFIEENSRFKKTVTAADGNIYSIGKYNPSDVRATVHYINKTWLNKLGMETPKTTQDLRNVLIAFKENDLDGNGKLDSLGISAVGVNRILDLILPAFMEPTNVLGFSISDGKVFYAAQDSRYKEMVRYLNGLYKDGLIDTDSITQNRQELIVKIQDKRAAGLLMDTPADAFSPNPDENDTYEVLAPLVSEYNNMQWTRYAEDCYQGQFMVTSKNKYPEASVRWVDIWWRTKDEVVDGLYGESMSRGPLGEHWRFTNEERTQFEMNQDPAGSLTETLYRFKVAAPAAGPYLADSLAWTNYWLQVKADGSNENYFPYMVETFPTAARYTIEEQTELSSVEADLIAYTEQMVTKFILGQESIDSSWDEFMQQMSAIGVERAVSIRQNAYDIWQSIE